MEESFVPPSGSQSLSPDPTSETSKSPYHPPSSPGFHGFGDDTVLPGQLVLVTEGDGDEEQVVRVFRDKKTGMPRGGDVNQDSSRSVSSLPRSQSSQPPEVVHCLSPKPPSTKATPKNITSSKTRPKVYLLDKLNSEFRYAKLPKGKDILSVFLFHLKDNVTEEDAWTAAVETIPLLKEVWKHHFGERVVLGYDSAMKEVTKKMIFGDQKIREKIMKIWKEWKVLERTSRRPDRANKLSFLKKQGLFENEILEMPFNILIQNYEEVLQHHSGIKDWKEDLQHLHNQLQREQVGVCARKDFKQKKRDDRKVMEKIDMTTDAGMNDVEEDDEDEEDVVDNGDEADIDFDPGKEKKVKTKMLDIMGPVTATADRLGLSVRQRTMMAASVTNTLGIDIKHTNINKSSAFKKAQKQRLKISETIMEEFEKPEQCVVHWDGKILKVKGNLQSNRVCVYLTGADAEKARKLLGVPETKDGTGAAECEVVKEMLMKWKIKGEVCAMVFDTTSSNTGGESGACKYLELWLETPILWLACRHHVYELHLKRVVQEVTGQTKDPGVALFRKLKADWHTMEIDYGNLCKFDYSSVPDWMQQEGKDVLSWAERELVKNTWPREDYRELLKLTIVCLGGEVPNFQFLLPGPDHHARWMSKCLYYLKLKLLLKTFKISDVQQAQVEEISTFILIFYVKAWFLSPLSTAAARNDLSFMANMLRYRLVTKPRVVFAVLQSCYRHLWYLVPQTVILALADPGLSDSQKEGMARKLHSLERSKIETGKPVFPVVDWSGESIQIPEMSSFVTSSSWLIFNLLGLTGSQDWLTVPASLWDNFQEFRKLKEFALNIAVCNDIAERGIAMITRYIDKAESEEQVQALLQVVEFHRALVTNSNKTSLKLC